jgi:site-specific recombinase XerD
MSETLLIPDDPPTPAQRKLHAGHFAFMRAYVQGVDLRESWSRYLAIEGRRNDMRVVMRTVTWLRDAFAAAAQRHGRHGLARLVRTDLAGVKRGPEGPQPSLEEFALERGLLDFSYQEQIEAYQTEHGNANGADKRGARLLRKQLEALSWLEQLAAAAPHADDSVRAWLHPDLAARLEAAGLATLRQLAERVNGVGKGWHACVRGVGAGKADRIVSWLQGNSDSTRLPIGPHVLTARRSLDEAALQLVVPHATGVVPLDKFIVPADLDGSAGRFRAPQAQCQLMATNDYDALLAFLQEKQLQGQDGRAAAPAGTGRPGWLQNLGQTARAYLTECERFMLWAILERGKPLSSITFEDCTTYRSFLVDPQPAARWCGQRGRERWGPAWRPFTGPLSPAAQRRALTMLGTFYRFLVDQRYLTGNPWSGVRKPRADHEAVDMDRSLTLQEWRYVQGRLAMLPPTSANLRLRFALPLLYTCRLRRDEAVRARVRDLQWTVCPAQGEEPEASGWELNVVGKGGKLRKVPLGPANINALSEYLGSRGLDRLILAPDNADAQLLGKAVDIAARAPWSPGARATVDPCAGISGQTLYDQIKTFFALCAEELASDSPQAARQLRRASTHWLRHTGITHSLAAGTPIDVEMAIAGHSSAATTGKYTHAEQRRRLLESARFLALQATEHSFPT